VPRLVQIRGSVQRNNQAYEALTGWFEMLATEILKEEHRIIEKVLNALEAFALRLERGEEVNTEVFETSVDFIRNFADKCHHGKEEDRLFTFMTRQGLPKNSGPIAVMLQEHDLGRSFVKAMDNAIKGYKNGDISSKKDIIENAREYTNLLRQHIYKEDNALYPLADKTIREKDQKNLLKEFEKFERKEIGIGFHEKYHRLAEKLEIEAGLQTEG